MRQKSLKRKIFISDLKQQEAKLRGSNLEHHGKTSSKERTRGLPWAAPESSDTQKLVSVLVKAFAIRGSE